MRSPGRNMIRQTRTAGSGMLPAVSRFQSSMPLPASATVPATTMETASMRAATVETTTTANRAAVKAATVSRWCSMEPAACDCPAVESSNRTPPYITTAGITTAGIAASAIIATSAISPRTTPARITVPWTSVPAVATTPVSQPPRTVEPWARSNEQAARKPVSAVVAIRCTSVGIISVVSIRTDRRCTNPHAHRPHSNSHFNLRLRIRKRHRHHHRQHRQIFHVAHTHLPGLGTL